MPLECLCSDMTAIVCLLVEVAYRWDGWEDCMYVLVRHGLTASRNFTKPVPPIPAHLNSMRGTHKFCRGNVWGQGQQGVKF